MLEAITKIESYASRGRQAFEQDELIQTWVVHHLQLVGEAARRLSDGLRQAHPEVPWKEIVGMRHILVHDYFRVDLDEVWAAVERDLPVLRKGVEAILNSLGDAPAGPS